MQVLYTLLELLEPEIDRELEREFRLTFTSACLYGFEMFPCRLGRDHLTSVLLRPRRIGAFHPPSFRRQRRRLSNPLSLLQWTTPIECGTSYRS